MALATTGEPNHHTMNTTTNNTNLSAGSAKNAASNAAFKTIYIGKEQRTLSIRQIANLTDPVWKRSSTFNHFATTMKGMTNIHHVADLVTTVANEMPISTEAAMEEAESAGQLLRREFFNIRNLDGSHFLTGKGKRMDPTSDSLKDRPVDLMYFAFVCSINPKKLDARMEQDPFDINFCLKLPQSVYDVKNDRVVEDLGRKRHAGTAKSAAKGLSKLLGMTTGSSNQGDYVVQKELFPDNGNYKDGSESEEAFDDEDMDGEDDEDEVNDADDVPEEDNPPVIKKKSRKSRKVQAALNRTKAATAAMGKETSSPTRAPAKKKNTLGATLLPTSPKMNFLLRSGSTASDKTTVGYYGPFTFLDDQASFDKVFGKDPTMFPLLPLTKTFSRDDIDKFIDKCKFDVFIEACRGYFVGMQSKESSAQATHEACKQISALKQAYKDGPSGKMITDNPDMLFGKFMSLVPTLPDDATKWSIQLCYSYYNALTLELRTRMESDDFVMPKLNLLLTKRTQIDAVQEVREQANTAYKHLQEQSNLIRKLMGQQGVAGGHRRPGSHHNTQQYQDPEYYGNQSTVPSPYVAPPAVHSSVNHLYNQRSPAEETVSKYSSTDQMNLNPFNLPTRKGPTGEEHPFSPDDPSYLSIYPIGFRGCFRCGLRHTRMDGCSKEHDPAAKRIFWKELWIHKPNTKKVKDLGTGGHNQVRYPRNSSLSTSIWSVCCARNIGALCNLESLLAHHVATYQSRYQH